MPKSFQRRLPSETRGRVERPLNEQDKIDSALQTMCRRLNKVMTAERINLWHEDLAPYPVAAIEYALECWGKNAKALPTFADLSGLLNSWVADNMQTQFCGNCDTGWIRGFKDHAGNDAVKRCECVQR
jgi:hypothetical protein